LALLLNRAVQMKVDAFEIIVVVVVLSRPAR
jgi:hypothetical protein